MFSRPATAPMFSVLLVAAFMLASVFVVPVHAGGVVGNGTPGSCTEAAFDAALVGGGVVTCNCGPNPVTITLTGQKFVGSAITIDGGGLITLSGNDVTRLFNMNTLAGPAHMELKNITLERGSANNGGAVYVGTNQTVWMESVTIKHSYAALDGGAIYVDANATLTLANVVFDHNISMGEGAGVYNSKGTLHFATVLFYDNLAQGWGGGMNNNQGVATLTDVTFRQNRAGFFGGAPGGGGIDSYNSTLTMTDSHFEDNDSYNDGAGLRVMGGGTASLTNVTLSGNQAVTTGGGIMNNDGVVTLTNVTLSANQAFTSGGGVYNSIGAVVTLTNSTLSGNMADAMGGGIYNASGDVTLINTTLSGNLADKSAIFSNGGGLSTGFGTATITNCTFSANRTSGYGGGLYTGNSTVTITNSTFSGNSANVSGGGIFNNTITPVTLRNTIVANSTSGGNCGGDPIINDGNNIDDGTTCGWGSSNGSMSSTDPLLGALQDNGGPTLTHLPGTGSLAIDHGTDAGSPATDQRGVLRPQDGDKNGSKICDIGAVEVGGTVSGAPKITKITSKTSKPGSNAKISGTGFSTDKTKEVVYFGAMKAKISKTTATSIKVKIPKGVKGTVQVYAVVNGKESNRVSFTIK